MSAILGIYYLNSRPVDRADLERRACIKPFNIRAADIQGESYSW